MRRRQPLVGLGVGGPLGAQQQHPAVARPGPAPRGPPAAARPARAPACRPARRRPSRRPRSRRRPAAASPRAPARRAPRGRRRSRATPTGQAISDGVAQFSPAMIESWGWSRVTISPGGHRLQHARRRGRLDPDDERALGPGPVVAHHRGRQRADADRHGDHVRAGAPAELLVDLGEHRRVALDDPRRDLLVSLPRGVGDDQAVLRGVLRGAGDGVVVAPVHHGDGGALRRDGLDPGAHHVVRHVDRGVQAQQRGHVGHGAPVVAVGGGAQRQRPQRRHGVAQRGEGGDLLGGRAQPLEQRAVDRPRCAEHLERRQAQSRRTRP